MANIISTIHKATKDIITATTRVSVDRKLAFNRAEQKTVHTSVSDINNNLQLLLGLLYTQESRITKLQEKLIGAKDAERRTPAPTENSLNDFTQEILNKLDCIKTRATNPTTGQSKRTT